MKTIEIQIWLIVALVALLVVALIAKLVITVIRGKRQATKEIEDDCDVLAHYIIEECVRRRLRLESGHSSEFIYQIFDDSRRRCAFWLRMTITRRSIEGNVECARLIEATEINRVQKLRIALRHRGIKTLLIPNVPWPTDKEICPPTGEKIDQPA